MTAKKVTEALQEYANADDAQFLQRFFKTGKGEYGEGDIFIGVRVPQTRAVCKQFRDLPLGEVQILLDSEVHEHRLAGLIILTLQFQKASAEKQAVIYELYLGNVRQGKVNNWDLIDLSAPNIVGAYLLHRPRSILLQLASHKNLWQRRVAVLATFMFIKNGDPAMSLELAERLMDDKRDLIQKAVGWMLREIGKRCGESILTDFLDKNAAYMPRTMLRYSIERLSPGQRKKYMHATVPQ